MCETGSVGRKSSRVTDLYSTATVSITRSLDHTSASLLSNARPSSSKQVPLALV